MNGPYITPGLLSRIEADWQYNRKTARLTEKQLTDELAQHDGYATSTPLNGSEGIGSTSGPKTSTVERAALGEHGHLDSVLASIHHDVKLLGIVNARLAATIKATLTPVAPPATCNGGLGREGADEWGHAPCGAVAHKLGMCSAIYMAERRWREKEGLTSREES